MPSEEAGQGLRKLRAVDGMRDEVPPGRGHALEAADKFGGEASEDLDNEVIGQAARRGLLFFNLLLFELYPFNISRSSEKC